MKGKSEYTLTLLLIGLRALIKASATWDFFALPMDSLRWTQWRGRYRNHPQHRCKHRAWLSAEKPLRCRRPVGTCEKKIAHSTALRGRAWRRSSKASGGEDLQVEEPVLGWDFASFHFHTTLASMLGPTLIRYEVV